MNDTPDYTHSWRRLAALGGAALMLGGALAFTASATDDTSKPSAPHLEVSDAPLARDGKWAVSFAPTVKRVAPSVVKVSVASKPKPLATAGGGLPDFRQFFGEGGGNGWGPETRLHTPRQHGVGSGVIVTKDGYILTNNHVVDGADDIKVELNDGRQFTGKVVGRDPKTDVAVLKIKGEDLPAIVFADSDKIEVGDVALAIGNPFGIGQTVTKGIISAKDRATMGLDYEDFIQTDAAINPGNSGGALVDAEGRLIGLNTAILSHSGGNQGIGFAVPANLARWVMDSLVTNGKVERSYLGVNIQDLTPQLAREFKLDRHSGALVAEVKPHSPAAKAGLKDGDVIIAFNGKPVTDSRRLKLEVGETAPRSTVPVKLLREGGAKTVQVTLKELPGEEVAKASSPGDAEDDALHGVAVTELDGASRTELNIPQEVHGALISQVEPDSAAFEAGLRPGDVITEINRKPIRDAAQAVAACEKPGDRHTLVKIWSRTGSRYALVDESKNG